MPEYETSFNKCAGLPMTSQAVDCYDICPVMNFSKYLEKKGYKTSEGVQKEPDDGIICVFDVRKGGKTANIILDYATGCDDKSFFKIKAKGALADEIISLFKDMRVRMHKFSKVTKELKMEDLILEED
ncbi:MAG: hypothetical protein V1839_03030 [archaeon]